MVGKSNERGSGSPAFVAVNQDATGHAMETALAFAVCQETELDLFQEQGLWPLLVRTMITA